ncbi:hypothetical protein GN958_ATG06375 [Phytophthora infestans]|uniref:M96 mating-specific protein family n=1 Tax=Phytophthora infestans TaxID=4787 RepID=A0A8S9UZ56_PHYIN|nr:hypothetical protein GN958_ATG06375 [Phytophthora infestans]
MVSPPPTSQTSKKHQREDSDDESKQHYVPLFKAGMDIPAAVNVIWDFPNGHSTYLEMQANNELLSDAAFFEEAADFLDRNCFSPTSTLFNDVDERETNLDELDQLRGPNDELSLKLNTIKLAKEARRNPSQQSSIWKEIALVQRDERLRSETEKRRLTATAKAQTTYIKDLRRLLHLHENSAALESTVPRFVITDTTHHRLETPDVSMFSTLLQKICASFAGIDDILTGCGLSDMPMGVTSSMHWCDDTGELKYHQSLQKFTLPFDLDTAQKSCWESFNFQHHQRDRKDYDGVEDSDNTVALKYRVIRTLASGTTVSVMQRLVGRRFIEQNRVVGTVFGKHTRKARGRFAACTRPKQDGVVFGRCQTDQEQ